MFSCILDDPDDGSSEQQRQIQRALQVKCSRLAKLLEETEQQRLFDREDYERRLALAEESCVNSKERLDSVVGEAKKLASIAQHSHVELATYKHRLSVSESEIAYWRGKYARQEESESGGMMESPCGQSLNELLDISQPSWPEDGSVYEYSELGIDAETSVGTDEEDALQGHNKDAMSVWAVCQAREGQLVKSHTEAIKLLRVQHLKQCTKLRTQIENIAAERDSLRNELDKTTGMLTRTEHILFDLRAENNDLKARLDDVLHARDAVAANVEQVLIENKALVSIIRSDSISTGNSSERIGLDQLNDDMETPSRDSTHRCHSSVPLHSPSGREIVKNRKRRIDDNY